MGGFRNDLGRLDEHASEFDDLAGRAQQVAEALRRAVDSAGACWGGDEIGANFARAHCGRADQALSGLGEVSARLRGMGSKFAAVAATSQQVDADNAEELGRITERG
ncbi:hypothetical protein ABT324_20960 [Saccharopolyspora sp. NPDC000359]|uniref:WXG100 family type VII secretion target n=1 Tax=Saccharopolyspora sp. NPDC000359 TaxID=3154251 RepID=UPI00332436EB